tara:strand:+ start:283 stop:936 length:654 start_codon:yes stop_codon:yes gene_type:complete
MTFLKFFKYSPKIQLMLKYLYNQTFIIKVIALISIFLNSGCAPLLFNATSLATVNAYDSEKGVSLSLSDTFLKAQIKETLFQTNVNDYRGISVSVNDGIVLLTGKVKKPNIRIESTKLTWSVRGVKEVINEVIVSDGSSVRDAAKDLTAETSLKFKLLSDKDISSSNYNVDVVNGIAFISGVSKDKNEMDKVISIAKNIKYINEIVNYLILSESLSQ